MNTFYKHIPLATSTTSTPQSPHFDLYQIILHGHRGSCVPIIYLRSS